MSFSSKQLDLNRNTTVTPQHNSFVFIRSNIPRRFTQQEKSSDSQNKRMCQTAVSYRSTCAIAIVSIFLITFSFSWYKTQSIDWHHVTREMVSIFGHQPYKYVCSSSANESWKLYRAVVVNKSGTLLERIDQFNCELDSIRLKHWLMRGGLGEWTFQPNSTVSVSVPRQVVDGANDFHLREISKFEEITTIIVPWSSDSDQKLVSTEADEENLLIKDYYIWSATEPLCSWISSKTPINNLKYNMLYREDCNTNLSAEIIERARSLPRVFINAINANRVRYHDRLDNATTTDSDFYEKSPPITFYCHVINDAIVTDVGDVFTYNVKIVPFGCSNDLTVDPPGGSFTFPLYEEVLVITQYWGVAVFHRMIEIMPRVVLFLDFLKRHPQIRILAPEGNGGRLAELIQILGLDPNRLVMGSVRAKVVYLPRPSMCGMASLPEIQILSQHYRAYIIQHLLTKIIRESESSNQAIYKSDNMPFSKNQLDSKRNTTLTLPRNRLVVIRRSGLRQFTQQAAIETMVAKTAGDFNLTYELFSDNPTPSLKDTMILFHSAVMVVAPHGAGLANIVFSQPGMYIVEGVCNTPDINLCFHRPAVLLGHHWHGIPSRGGCETVIDVDAGVVDTVVRSYLSGRRRS